MVKNNSISKSDYCTIKVSNIKSDFECISEYFKCMNKDIGNREIIIQLAFIFQKRKFNREV